MGGREGGRKGRKDVARKEGGLDEKRKEDGIGKDRKREETRTGMVRNRGECKLKDVRRGRV